MSAALLERMDQNLASHAAHLHAAVPGARVDAVADVTITDSGLDHDTFNQIVRARFGAAEASRRVTEVLEQVRGRGRPFSWWVGPASDPATLRPLLSTAGSVVDGTDEAMWADLSGVPGPTVPDGLDLQPITTRAQLADYATMIASGWDPPALPVARFFTLAADAILDPACLSTFVLGRLDGVPVTGAEVHRAADVAGVYGVMTEPGHRRRGFGSAATLAVLDLARREGYRHAVLQASEEGAALYRRLGFTVIGRYTEHAVTG